VKTLWKTILMMTVAVLTPAHVFACAACGSANPYADRSSLTDGMNLGIMTLLGVIVSVLAAFLTFIIYLIRKSEAVNAAAEKLSTPTDV
jgi:hypothetical protein